MTESKIELTERLRREGRWEEASRFKDTAVRDLREKGTFLTSPIPFPYTVLSGFEQFQRFVTIHGKPLPCRWILTSPGVILARHALGVEDHLPACRSPRPHGPQAAQVAVAAGPHSKHAAGWPLFDGRTRAGEASSGTFIVTERANSLSHETSDDPGSGFARRAARRFLCTRPGRGRLTLLGRDLA